MIENFHKFKFAFFRSIERLIYRRPKAKIRWKLVSQRNRIDTIKHKCLSNGAKSTQHKFDQLQRSDQHQKSTHELSLYLSLSLLKLIFNMNINYAPLNFDSIEVTKYHSHNFDFAIDIEETSKCENTRSMIHWNGANKQKRVNRQIHE